jgi:hypothetical protein
MDVLISNRLGLFTLKQSVNSRLANSLYYEAVYVYRYCKSSILYSFGKILLLTRIIG